VTLRRRPSFLRTHTTLRVVGRSATAARQRAAVSGSDIIAMGPNKAKRSWRPDFAAACARNGTSARPLSSRAYGGALRRTAVKGKRCAGEVRCSKVGHRACRAKVTTLASPPPLRGPGLPCFPGSWDSWDQGVAARCKSTERFNQKTGYCVGCERTGTPVRSRRSCAWLSDSSKCLKCATLPFKLRPRIMSISPPLAI
jgi:hypothetical protein